MLYFFGAIELILAHIEHRRILGVCESIGLVNARWPIAIELASDLLCSWW